MLMEVAAWREREAQTRDVPRGRVLKDDALVDLATSAPRTPEALGRLRSIPNGYERSRTAGDILAAVERGLGRDPKTVPALERFRRSGATGAVVDLLKVLLKSVAENEGVAPDVEVEQTPADVIAGKDPQLEKAIALVMAELAKSPPAAPKRPAIPQRARTTAP